MNKKTRNIIVLIASIVVVAGAAIGGYVLWNINEYRRIIDGINLEMPDLGMINDGTFSGSFDARLVSADVEVTVSNHAIMDVRITNHDHGNWEDAIRAEVVAQRVVDAQSLHVDTVANATNSSLVILSAIQNALENAMNN